VNNGASRSITKNRKDFIDTPCLVYTIIKGYLGTSEASLIGTVRWTIADDQGWSTISYYPTPYLMKKLKRESYLHSTEVKQPMTTTPPNMVPGVLH
jgi:hypothetical protein